MALLNNCTAHPGTIEKIINICSTLFNMKMAYYPSSWQHGEKEIIFDPDELDKTDHREKITDSFLSLANKINNC